MKRTCLLLFASILSIYSLSQDIKLKFVETTDVHGCIFPYDFVRQEETNNSLAQVHTYVKKERENKKQKLILLDNGDFLQGQPVAYYYNFEDTIPEHIFSRVFNYMQYDAATVGNHDVETGHAVYDKVGSEFEFSWLAANAINTRTGKPYWKPYEIIEFENVRIAILGLITPGIPKWLPQNIWEGIEFTDMIETARYWMDHINKNGNPDLVVGLFHSGIDYTYGGETAKSPNNENASLLVAEQVPGFDIVFAGHDHQKYNAFVENISGEKVLLLNGASHARYVAVADVIINKDNDPKIQLEGQLIDMAEYDPDKDFMQHFNDEFVLIKDYVNQSVASLEHSIDSKDAYFGSSAFIDLIHHLQLELTGAEISLAAPLTYRTRLDSGEILVCDMFKLYKFENLLYTMNLTGQEIDSYLEYSYSKWINTMSDSSDYLFNYRFNQEGKPEKFFYPFYDFDSALGIKYTVDLRKPDGDKVAILSMQNGDAFHGDSVYSIAINSYRGNGGGGHLTKGVGLSGEDLSERLVHSTDIDLRFLIMQWLKKEKTFTPESFNNWKFIPENWIDYRRSIEEEILFPN